MVDLAVEVTETLALGKEQMVRQTQEAVVAVVVMTLVLVALVVQVLLSLDIRGN
jgi:hypothetical protein